ncbi:hypothetical protein [Spirosoma telluris]
MQYLYVADEPDNGTVLAFIVAYKQYSLANKGGAAFYVNDGLTG